MKKIYTIVLITFVALHAEAQITITQSNLPAIGWGYINATDSTYAAAISPGGASQSWNYASLLNLDQDSLLFQSATGTPYAAQFPGANLAAFDPQTGAYAYFTSSASGFYLNGGAGSQLPIALVYNPAQMFIPVPFTYNSTYSGYSRFQVDTVIGGVNTRIVQHTSVNILGDGWGSLVIPTGSHPNTLRAKTTLLRVDSIYINLGLGWTPLPGYTPTQTQTTNFKWMENGNGTLMLEIEADSLGQNATFSNYLVLFGIVGINEITNAQTIQTYPNPASNLVTFGFDDTMNSKTSLYIYDALGQQVEINDVTGLNSFTMSTSHLSNGVYSYMVQNEKGIQVKGKMVVAH